MAEQGGGAESVQERFEDLCFEFMGAESVTGPAGGSGFGRSALRYRGKIFAMLVRGRLVLKLPAGRVDELVEGGNGVPFDANKGTPMKEWFSLDPAAGRAWLPLAEEALAFVRRTVAAGGKAETAKNTKSAKSAKATRTVR
ncbi:MAG TPA: hypothetical protein VGX23_31080 [Actinocrinis sp.]|nr:hypothetical protein [Actinocrinis sp.]